MQTISLFGMTTFSPLLPFFFAQNKKTKGGTIKIKTNERLCQLPPSKMLLTNLHISAAFLLITNFCGSVSSIDTSVKVCSSSSSKPPASCVLTSSCFSSVAILKNKKQTKVLHNSTKDWLAKINIEEKFSKHLVLFFQN
ncbi:hypothetical protein RFI_00192 [Reticulomyxa filosa]|uniref:Uncharacterized protein n=1 Tax=Reticulomyxa filosa TaxID=46433 RepID=X6PGT3_RETFI|nr:hypothetical protein RFI_00192 [Reticulomyxa filosa]|eukprot:ETO36872.1 hypothetical protein RFI_00192 [Reticulomyxa filosa]